MELNIQTLAFAATVATLTQAAALYFYSRINKTLKGPGWWAFGSAAWAVGFVMNLARGVPAVSKVAIAANNVFFVAGLLLLYIGIQRFLGQNENKKRLVIFSTVFSLTAIIFTFLIDNLVVRRVNFSVAIAVSSILIALALLKQKETSIGETARLLIVLYLSHGAFYIVRALSPLISSSVGDIFSSSPLQITTYLVALSSSGLWTTGLIMLANQRLAAENREAKEYLETIQNTNPDALFIINLTANQIVDINEGFTNLTGYVRSEVVGFPTYKTAICVGYDGRPLDLVTAIDQRKPCDNLELSIQTKSGKIINGLISTREVVLRGNPHIIGVIHDITNRMHIEEALRESESKYRTLFNRSPDAYLIIQDGVFVDCNRAAEVMLRTDRDRILRRTPAELSPEFQPNGQRSTDLAQENINETTQAGSAEFEWKHRRADGSDLQVQVSTASILLDGKSALFVIWRDISLRLHTEAALRETNAFLESLINYSNAPIVVWNSQMRITRFNHAFEILSGYSEGEMLGRPVEMLFPQRLAGEYMQQINGAVSSNHWETTEVTILHRDGAERTILWNPATIYDQNEKTALATIAHGQDITERKQMEKMLSSARDFYLKLLSHAPALIWRADTDAKCDWFNKTWLDFTGRTLEQEMGDGWAEGVHPDDYSRCLNIYLEAFGARQPFVMDYRLRHASSEYRWITDHGIPIETISGEFGGYIGYCFDITERRSLQEELQRQATTDSLTGVSNRRYFIEMATNEIKRSARHAHPLAVILMDIDLFKTINDTYGHAVGDRVLVNIARICMEQTRETDHFARFGGDEFVLLLPETTCDQAVNIIERIRRQLLKLSVDPSGKLVPITLSCGLAYLDGVYEPIDVLLSRADKALYEAKAAGRNEVKIAHPAVIQ